MSPFLSFCSREREAQTSCWRQQTSGNHRGACVSLPITVRNRPQSLEEESCRCSLNHNFKGWACRGAVRDDCGVCAYTHTPPPHTHTHTHMHPSDRWPIEIISELFCGCYDNQCSLGFHLAMWQGLWRQLEAESVAESTQSKACENLVDAGCRRCS